MPHEKIVTHLIELYLLLRPDSLLAGVFDALAMHCTSTNGWLGANGPNRNTQQGGGPRFYCLCRILVSLCSSHGMGLGSAGFRLGLGFHCRPEACQNVVHHARLQRWHVRHANLGLAPSLLGFDGIKGTLDGCGRTCSCRSGLPT